jgi:hypothetical protein
MAALLKIRVIKKTYWAFRGNDCVLIKGRLGIPRHPSLYQCYFICIIFFVAEAVASV